MSRTHRKITFPEARMSNIRSKMTFLHLENAKNMYKITLRNLKYKYGENEAKNNMEKHIVK